MMIKIRKAEKRDVPVLADFQQHMALETEQLVLDRSEVLKGVDAVLEDGSKGFYLVSEEAEVLTGCLMITREWSDWRGKWVWWIQSLYVLPSERKKGIYSALYERVQQLVEVDPDVAGVRLYVDKSNLRAIEVYRHMGMNGDHYQLFEWMKSNASR